MGRSDTSRKTGGFTLLELLVAMAVFAMIAAVAYAGLDSAIVMERKLDDEGRKWKNLSFFFAHLERDLACFVDKPVIGQDGVKLLSMAGRTTDKSGARVELTFTRLGRGVEGASPKRVGYRLNGDKIETLIWRSIDLPLESAPDTYEAMDAVSSFEVSLGGGGGWSHKWSAEAPPGAVEVTVTLKSGETIRRMIVLR